MFRGLRGVLQSETGNTGLVLCIVLFICTVWFCMLFCLFVQFGHVYCFAYLHSLVLHIICLFVQFGSVCCVVYLNNLVLLAVCLFVQFGSACLR